MTETLSDVEQDAISFDRLQGVLHGGYQSSLGEIELDDRRYDVQIYEQDEGLYVQVRGEEGLVDDGRVESMDPYDLLPETDGEMYEIVRDAGVL